ncbi:dTDP-4-dehydrorhamnose reductase [Sphingomonas sp. CBMAI 2297]|uniref:dTDP-4-dehydrorhamnose reductase n=1 Tax=Sphingomonas sp. CBMAI 2297 TaxID=2991720 RepID=UPI0024553F40|nr:dTDP-4-dehydrorhamnose reductase [Sphingomonas sp. CBMAI 2297]MDH4742985.1 dTDP-4-dehydrorhamnose reductase [Sphingomonas sp. CBMAI 2297]
MRILVTGRDGQVARALAARSAGHELLFLGRPELDLARPEAIHEAVARLTPDLVFSVAAYTAVDRAEVEPAVAEKVNAAGPGALARAAAAMGAPIVHLSTDYVFDGTLDRPYREEDVVGPIGAYGATKLRGEQAVRESGAEWLILRTAWVYSPFGGNFVRTMLRLAEERAELSVVSDQIGCPTSAFDIADALLQVAGQWSGDGAAWRSGLYHFAGSEACSWADFARRIFSLSGEMGGPAAHVRDIPASEWPTRARRPANSRLDSAHFAEVFGFRAQGFDDGLRPVIAAILEQVPCTVVGIEG